MDENAIGINKPAGQKHSKDGDLVSPTEKKPKEKKSTSRHPMKEQEYHQQNAARYRRGGGATCQKGRMKRYSSHGSTTDGVEISKENKREPDGRRHSTDGSKNPPHSKPKAGSKPTKGSVSRYGHSLSESTQNGGSGDFDYHTDEFELDEPFSESDEESAVVEETRRKRQAKPLLPIPRRRIRTLSGTVPSVGYSPVWGGPTMCLNCLEFFDLPSHTAQYIEHLLEKHNIVITDIELIVDLKRYVEHWRHRFGQEPIEKIFPLVQPSDSDPLHGKVERYYLMSETVPEDRQIRESLALRRLDEVLQCQQREREEHNFQRQCLFCRYQPAGNRSKLIHHLYTIHHLNLGSPDNLVFINEYLDVLDGKLKNNECIYCEKKFDDHQALTDHMRKRQHREVNPKNHYYDRFYVINYLELGKRWLEVLEEDFEDTTPAFVDSDEEEEEETWNEWEEDAGVEISAMCLFCDDLFTTRTGLLDHMKGKHNYDFTQIVADEKLDFYHAVKLVNYIRKQSYHLVCFICGKEGLRPRSALAEHLQNEGHVSSKLDKEKWNKEEYLIPTFENDDLLLLLGEIVGETGEEQSDDDPQGPESPNSVLVIPEDAPELDDTVLNDSELRDQLQ